MRTAILIVVILVVIGGAFIIFRNHRVVPQGVPYGAPPAIPNPGGGTPSFTPTAPSAAQTTTTSAPAAEARRGKGHF